MTICLLCWIAMMKLKESNCIIHWLKYNNYFFYFFSLLIFYIYWKVQFKQCKCCNIAFVWWCKNFAEQANVWMSPLLLTNNLCPNHYSCPHANNMDQKHGNKLLFKSGCWCSSCHIDSVFFSRGEGHKYITEYIEIEITFRRNF